MSGSTLRRSGVLSLCVLLAACGAGVSRRVLPSPHAAMLLPEPVASAPTLELPSVHRAVLPSGLVVHVVSRPDALMGHVALRASPGALLSQGQIGRDRVIARLLEDVGHARVSVDRGGLRIGRDVSLATVVVEAARLVTMADDPALSESAVFRASALVSEAQQHPQAIDVLRTTRLYGENTLEGELSSRQLRIPQPSLLEVRARLAELLAPPRTSLVIVGREPAETVIAALTEALAGLPEAEPLAAAVPPPSTLRPRPQLHALGAELPVALVRVSVVGPGEHEADAAGFALAIRALAGTHVSHLWTMLRAEGDSYVVQTRVEPQVGHVLATIQLSVRPADVDEAVTLVLSEVARLAHPRQISERVLATARQLELTAELARVERASELAASILDAELAGVGLEAHASRFAALSSASAGDVAAAFSRYLPPEALCIEVVAPTDQLANLPPVPGGTEVSPQRR